MKRILVIGGGGFVGSAIVKKLLRRGMMVTVFGRSAYPAIEKLGCRVIRGDIRDRNCLVDACHGFDTVFHTAAKAGVWGPFEEYNAINFNGTENVLHACRRNRVKRVVYTSTPSVVFDRGNIRGGDESLPYAPDFLCHYARTKAMAEARVLVAGDDDMKTCALRPHLIWGPGDPHLIPRLVARAASGRLRQVGSGTNLVDIAYIDNVADAHLLAAENLAGPATAAGKAYFISQGQPVNLWAWINTLLKRLNMAPPAGHLSFARAYAVGAVLEAVYSLLRCKAEPPMTRFVAEQLARSHWFSIQRARQDISYEPQVSTEQGMEHLVSWLRNTVIFGKIPHLRTDNKL